ncbi:MAG TPA: hypothetical protein VN645_16175 [Steroidobacteraceae bacterium]|nr:hypothetical protein [Steroidobacteraceae bacterium]
MPLSSAHRLILLASGLLLAGFASAQTPGQGLSGKTPAYESLRDGSKEPSAISLSEASMSFYKNVIAQERQKSGSGVAMLSSALKIDEATSRAYLNFMYMAIDDGAYQFVEKSRLICLKRKELTTPAQLADAFEKLHASVLVNWDYIVNRSAGVLGEDGKKAADTYILNARKGMKLPVTDYAKYVAASGRSVGEMIAEACDARPEATAAAARKGR